jgi:hypothetical protein
MQCHKQARKGKRITGYGYIPRRSTCNTQKYVFGKPLVCIKLKVTEEKDIFAALPNRRMPVQNQKVLNACLFAIRVSSGTVLTGQRKLYNYNQPELIRCYENRH